MPSRLTLQLPVLLSVLAFSAGAQALSFDFGSDAQGWTTSNGGAQVWLAEGGNSGGFLQISDVSDDDFLLNAPAGALGNWSAYHGGTLYFDARNSNGDSPDWQPFGEVTLSGPGGSVLLDIAPANQPVADGQWHRYSASLSDAAWGPSLGTVLANVTSFTIKGEFHAGVTEVVGIDNIAVTASAVPEPTVLYLLSVGLLVLTLGRRP
ncbi:hypothetical protein BH11PSE10_BH11PSE10_13970 [soil metagenome]